jgi:hypothetical protein
MEAGTQVHVSHRDEVFLRVGDENRKLSFTQRQELLYDKGQSTYEAVIVEGADVSDLDDELLRSYADALHHPDPLRLLSTRGLLSRSGEPTVAAVLLFASEPQRWFPEASVRVLRYRGTGTRVGRTTAVAPRPSDRRSDPDAARHGARHRSPRTLRRRRAAPLGARVRLRRARDGERTRRPASVRFQRRCRGDVGCGSGQPKSICDSWPWM